MENPRPEEQKNLFRLKKEQNGTAIKDIRNLPGLKKEVKGIKDIVIKILRMFLSMKKKKKIIINQ